MPSDKSKRDPDQKLNPPRPFSSPGFAKVIQSIKDQLLDQLHDQQNFFAELEQEPDRKKAPHAISQRSLDSDPRTADIKRRPAPVVEIPKPAATSEKAAAVPKSPEPRIPTEKINVDAVHDDDKEKKRIAAMNKVNDPKNNPFLRLDEAAAVLGLRSTRAVQKRIRDKKDPLEQGPHDGTVSMNSLRKALKI
jgi:hypothetical protein